MKLADGAEPAAGIGHGDGDMPTASQTSGTGAKLRPWYTVAVLHLAFFSAAVDVVVLSLLVEPVKLEFALSDTQMSLLLGFSFAVFFSVMGLPIAALADRGNRRNIIAVSIVVWSAFTAACGLARSYPELFLARVGVGIGEAGLFPAAISLLSDLFSRERRPLAMSIVQLGRPLGGGLGLLGGGLLLHWLTRHQASRGGLLQTLEPWRMIFLLVSLPGLAIAVLLLAVREPTRREVAHAAVQRRQIPPSRRFDQLLAYACRHRGALLGFYCARALNAASIQAMFLWLPAFFVRTHGEVLPGRDLEPVTQAGLAVGLVILLMSPLAMPAGGRLAEKWTRRGLEDANLRVCLVSSIGLVAASVVFPVMPSAGLSLLFLAPFIFFGAFDHGAATSALAEMVPNQMRAQAAAVNALLYSLVGLGLGPTLVALLTDYGFGDPAAVGRSILIVSASTSCLAGLLLWTTLGPFRRTRRSLLAAATARC